MQSLILKRWFVMTTLVVMASQMFGLKMSTALAATTGDVVINEVAWAGTSDGSNDEWIELYNKSNVTVDLSGWLIEDDGSTIYEIVSGNISPKGYFLIEDTEETVSNISSNSIIGLSLANAGDNLVLKDEKGMVVDIVNGTGGAWYAGNSLTKATMERVDPAVSADIAENWMTAIGANGAMGRTGTTIIGTPGAANSTYGGSGPEVSIIAESNFVMTGSELTFSVDVNSVIDLYAYNFEILYDPAVMAFVSANEGGFLKADGTGTAFNYALENGDEGKLVIGNARLQNPPTGLDGSGNIFTMTFLVDEVASGINSINFGGTSYLSDTIGRLPSKLTGEEFQISEPVDISLSNLAVSEGTDRYTLALNWDGVGATSYRVFRESVDGKFVQIGEVSDENFTDNGDIIPGLTYTYQVIGFNGALQSTIISSSGADMRGIKGDVDRNDRVDGGDIEALARSFGSGFGDEEYNAIADTNYDGMVDGSDLIDIGINFGITY